MDKMNRFLLCCIQLFNVLLMRHEYSWQCLLVHIYFQITRLIISYRDAVYVGSLSGGCIWFVFEKKEIYADYILIYLLFDSF